MTTEYEVVCCYETEYGAGISNSFKTIEEAMEEFKRVTNYDKEDQYYIVYLNKTLRINKYGNPDSREEIKVWRREEEKMTTQSKTLDCYNCEKKCDEEKMPYSKVWIGKVCDECYEEEEEKEYEKYYEVHCFEYDNDSCWHEDYNSDYECALERFNWITSRGGLYRNEYTGKATYCDKVILYEKEVDEYGEDVYDERDELDLWEKDEKLPQGNSAKKEEPTKLTSQNTGSKEEKMTEEMTSFGTAYHDGSGFADCDPTGKGYRKCKEEGWSKGKWCSECVYLDTRQEEEDGECNCESDDEYSVSESGCDNLGCGVKKEEQKKLILENVGSKEEKMTNEMTSFYEEETICSKCPLPLTEDDMAMGDGTICESCLEEQEDTGFGTAYHDGSGFADCDPTGKGYKKCKEEGWSKDKWCSECVYLDTRQEEKEEEKLPNWKKMREKINEDFTMALAWAHGVETGYNIATDGNGDDYAMEDFWKALDSDFIKDEWKVKIFTHFYDDYVIFNGEILLEEEEFQDKYPKMKDKEGNKIIQLETGEYVTQKKKIKLNIVKK